MNQEMINKKFKEYLSTLSEEDILKRNKKTIKETEEEYDEFKKDADIGICYLCKNTFSHFSEKKPCIHWLLGPYGPRGFKKKRHFHLIYENFSYHQIDSYLKWMANLQLPFFNINNLKEEKNPNKIIEHTVKFKDIEWSFSCSPGDMAGHMDKYEGKFPHYHFQMKTSQGVIISFSEFHIPFDEYDLFMFSAKNGDLEGEVIYEDGYSSGLQEYLDSVNPQEIIDSMRHIEEENKATFKLDTFITADPGKEIKGDDIARILKESKETGKTFTSLVKNLDGISVQTIISPGPAIPEITKRLPRSSKK